MTKIYDSTAQSGYLRLSESPIVSTHQINSQVLCDIDAGGFPVGIEFLNISQDKFQQMTERLELTNTRS